MFAVDIALFAVSCAACAADRAVAALVVAASIPLSTSSGRRDLSSFLVWYFLAVTVLVLEMEMVALAATLNGKDISRRFDEMCQKLFCSGCHLCH